MWVLQSSEILRGATRYQIIYVSMRNMSSCAHAHPASCWFRRAGGLSLESFAWIRFALSFVLQPALPTGCGRAIRWQLTFYPRPLSPAWPCSFDIALGSPSALASGTIEGKGCVELMEASNSINDDKPEKGDAPPLITCCTLPCAVVSHPFVSSSHSRTLVTVGRSFGRAQGADHARGRCG